jgi:putative oxidoreductase
VTRRSGPADFLIAALRVAAGIFFISVSTGKFFDHAREADDFASYGIPLADVVVVLVGLVELVGGALLVVGLLTRPAAAVLAANMVGAIATAGVQEGGSFHLGVAPATLAVMLLLLWHGPGRPSLDASRAARASRSGVNR